MSTWNPKANDIFLQAVEIDSPQARGNLLTEACGDDHELRAHVEELLAADDCAESFLELPAPGLEATDEQTAVSEGPGSQIGPYIIREQIGEGGFGVVYVAEQEKPVRRKVALKIIKPGMDTKEIIARFEAERQALAMMDHPNIATVLDVGATESGRPYFVMELVRGVPITEFCDQQKLSTGERLDLFLDVCRAVQHAHQKGIIHRDLKPSNVMVTMHDDRAVPKVIDFGVSKAIHTKLTEHTIYTAYGQMIGTPLYMSPEQAQLNAIDVDTRSDVYSLGVLLYELLTGTTPFDKETLKKAGFDEMRRIIREDEPPRPSDRLSTLNMEALSTACEKRGIDTRKLVHAYRGELDWIVMKALEKDRNRRYESASALAADIERYLNDEPVEACPPSWGYRTRKLFRRHKVAITTGAMVVAALLLGTGVSVWQAFEANRSSQIADDSATRERAARKEADAQREVADAQRESAKRQQKKAEENLQTAMDAMEEMYSLAAGWLASDTAATNAQRRFLDRAETFYRTVAASPDEYRLSPRRLAEIHWRIGLININKREFTKAATAFEAAIAIHQKLLLADPNDLEIRARLASNLNTAGVVYSRLGRNEKVESSYRAAQRHHRQLAEREPGEAKHRIGIAHTQTNLAILRMNENRLPEAEQLIRDAKQQFSAAIKQLPATRKDVNYLSTRTVLATVLRKQKRYDEANQEASSALSACELGLIDDGDNRDRRELQAGLHGELAAIFIAQEQFKAAVPHLRRQLQVSVMLMAAQRDPYTFTADMLFQSDPSLNGKEQPQHWYKWTKTSLKLARILRQTGQHRQAEIVLGKVIPAAGYLAMRYPKVLSYRIIAANVRAEAALLLADRWPNESRYQLVKAVLAWRRTIKDHDRAATYTSSQHRGQADAAWFVATFPEFDFTDSANKQAIDKAIAERPKLVNVLHDRAHSLYALGYNNWKSYAWGFERIVKQRGGSDAFDRFHLAIALAKTGKPDEALSWFNRGVEWMEQNKGSEDEELVELQSEAKKATGAK